MSHYAHIRITCLLALTLTLFLCSCSLEKEVDLNLPVYERELIVECYLEPGKPYRLLLQESVGYLDSFEIPLVDDATVVIRHNGNSDTLSPGAFLDFQGFKFFNYQSPTIVPEDFDNDFELFVRDDQGREVTARTRMMPRVSFKDISYQFDEDSMAAVTVRWDDFAGIKNYYRYSLHENEFTEDGLQFVFTLDDRIGDGEEFVLSSLFFREVGDTVITTVYHLEEAYWRYLQTTDDAQGANGNPFAQPTSIISNIEGGIGIFTGLIFDRDTIIIE